MGECNDIELCNLHLINCNKGERKKCYNNSFIVRCKCVFHLRIAKMNEGAEEKNVLTNFAFDYYLKPYIYIYIYIYNL